MDAKGCTKGNYSAGFKLLAKFQNQWEQIHVNSENNTSKAKTALVKLNSIEQSCTRRMNALNEFVTGYKSLSKLEIQIKCIDNDLKTLESCFSQIEDLLIVLKNHNENIKTSQNVQVTESNYELKFLEEKSLSEARKERLRIDHLKRVEEFERHQQQELDERRRILEQAFEEEKMRFLERNKEL